MEFALIHDNSLILGPIGLNIRMINSELEDLELEDKVTTQSLAQLPIHFSDGFTHLLEIEKEIPENDSRYHNVGNFSWEILKENDVPTKLKLTYPIIDKTLEEVKVLRKQEVAPVRREKENINISLEINGTSIEVSTSREERLMLASKLTASQGPYNFKFNNTWLEVTSENLQFIISEIDKVVQEAFDWELTKLQEIDACTTIDEVYNVVVREPIEQVQNNYAIEN